MTTDPLEFIRLYGMDQPTWEAQRRIAQDIWAGVPVVTSPYVPRGTAFLIDGNQLVVGSMHWEERRRFWYKPWTWLRKNRTVDWWRG